jgi:hypothetical protein
MGRQSAFQRPRGATAQRALGETHTETVASISLAEQPEPEWSYLPTGGESN